MRFNFVPDKKVSMKMGWGITQGDNVQRLHSMQTSFDRVIPKAIRAGVGWVCTLACDSDYS